MTTVKTVKYHVPHQGLYVYSRVYADKTELIILNNSGSEQVLHNDHYQVLTKEKRVGRNVLNGSTVNLEQPLVLSAGQSLIIEC